MENQVFALVNAVALLTRRLRRLVIGLNVLLAFHWVAVFMFLGLDVFPKNTVLHAASGLVVLFTAVNIFILTRTSVKRMFSQRRGEQMHGEATPR